MPIYEYQCTDCQSVFEEWQSGFEEREMECPECGGASRRLISHSSFHLKGGGWYADGYGGEASGSKSDTASEPGTASESAKTESGGADKAPASKPASDSSSAGSAS